MTLSLSAAIEAFSPSFPLGIALSGGADSTALLVACAERWPGNVVALHVNHGLQPAALDFQTRCTKLCESRHIELRLAQVDAGNRSGQSPEDAARIARYHALAALGHATTGLGRIQTIALAQHADDQVETVLLALSRGAGLAGLSGMRTHWQRDGMSFVRPLLRVSGVHLRRWLVSRGIDFVQDPSNADEAFTRNRLRAQVLPALEATCPQFRDTFARSASHAAQAVELLAALAEDDLRTILRDSDALPQIKALQRLTKPRQSNAVRHWLKATYGVMPSAAQLDELMEQVAACVTRGHQLHIKVGEGFVERRREVLAWYNPAVLLNKN
jgi:tRNA(Ile)-lysidine synthase